MKRFIVRDSEQALLEGYHDPEDLCHKWSSWDTFDVLVDTETNEIIWKDLYEQPEDMILGRSLGDLVRLIEDRMTETRTDD